MIHVIPFDRLGRMQIDWLNSRFHFNFSGVAAPMGFGFGPLRVWNDDEIQPQSGFPMHGHRDMEIITYVRRGAISHEDSLGNKGRTPAGDVQVMSAGTGIMHSEWNAEDEMTHLCQIRSGFGPLRVWNDDEIQPQSGFPMHGHRDMEIITYVRRGAISHEDSLGNKGRTPAGDVQVMSAGTGIMHSEWNAEDEMTHLFQI